MRKSHISSTPGVKYEKFVVNLVFENDYVLIENDNENDKTNNYEGLKKPDEVGDI